MESLLQGYGACIMAYGQTGSGKTHTMLGPGNAGRGAEGRGLVPRVLQSLFERLQEQQQALEAEVIDEADRQ